MVKMPKEPGYPVQVKLRSQSFYKDIVEVGKPRDPGVEGFKLKDYNEQRNLLKKVANLSKKTVISKKTNPPYLYFYSIPPERVH